MKDRHIIKRVKGIATSDGAGVSLTRIIGQPSLPRLDPFLMLDFFGSDKPNEYLAGFPAHPHRGFQTVTYMLDGKMRHKDSVGNEGVIEAGGIQWMNAGKGIIHEEMPEQEDGLLRGFQLWVNLPSGEKMSAPNYQDIKPHDVNVVKKDDMTVRVLAGSFEGCLGPVKTDAVDSTFLDVHLSTRGAVFSQQLALDNTLFVYVYEGSVDNGDERLESGELGVFGEGESLTVTANEACRFIVVAGKPLNEPVVQYGPFVMNTEQEIMQAIKDYQAGVLI